MTGAHDAAPVFQRIVFSGLVVLLLMAAMTIVFAAVAPRLICHLGDQRRELTTSSIKAIGETLTEFARSEGHYPDATQGLNALVERGFLKRKPVDGWQNDYDYSVSERGFTVRSYGADGKAGGTEAAADIVRTFSKLE